MNKISMNELEEYLWDSAVLLRTHIDAGEYKKYIFPLLFFKRMNDVFEEETNKSVEAYGPEAATWEEIHKFVIPDGYHWNDVRNVTENVGKAIRSAFMAMEQSNSEKLQGIFGDGAWTNKNKLPDRLLKDLMEHFSQFTLSLENCPEDELGQGYEYLIKKFADDSGHTAQEFYTNRTVVHLMTEMLRPESGESIYDPTCGSAGMLISAIAYLKKHGKEWRNVSLYGQEVNNLTAAIGKMNLFIHGIDDYQIVSDDTLLRPAFIEKNELKTFDLILANPPYSISEWNREAFASDKYGRNELGTPSQGIADFAFLQHIFKSLNSVTGRCAVLLPRGILSRYAEADIRKNLVKKDIVECVIAVGKGLFYNSPMEACILICKANKELSRKNKILMINASDLISRKDKHSFLTDEHIQKISQTYLNFTEIDGFSKVIANDEVLDKNGSMSISLYLPKSLCEDSDEPLSLSESIDNWLKSKELFAKEIDILKGLLGDNRK